MSTTIEELRKKLIEQAKREAERIIEEAKKKAEKIIEEAEKDWLEKSRKEKERIIANAETRARIIVSEAKRRARMRTVEAKNDVLKKVFDYAWRAIKERKGIDVNASLRNLLKEALNYVNDVQHIYVSGQDIEIMKRIIASSNLDAEVAEKNIIGGLIAESEKGELIDNSYETRFSRAKQLLVPEIARILWG